MGSAIMANSRALNLLCRRRTVLLIASRCRARFHCVSRSIRLDDQDVLKVVSTDPGCPKASDAFNLDQIRLY